MMEVLFTSDLLPFTGALAAVGAIGVLELVALLVAGPVMSHLHVDVDLHLEGSFLNGAMSWLHVGQVPLMLLIVLFLSGFGLSGAALQLGLDAFGFDMADALGASIPALGIGVATVRRGGGALAKMLGDDPTVVTIDSFVGVTARIVSGTATPSLPAEARFTDKFGSDHYFMVAPVEPDESFTTGTEIVLGQRTPFGFEATRKTKVIN
jgi:hypothetical protein